MTQWLWLTFVCCMVAATLPSRALAEEFREPAARWKLSNTDGWEQFSAESLQKANALAKSAVGSGNWSYTTGFKPTGHKDLTYPYVLVQTTRTGFQGASYAQLDEAFASAPNAVQGHLNTAAADVLSNYHMDRPILDRTTGRTYFRVQLDVKGIGKVQGYCVGFLGNEDMITLNFYDTPDKFSNDLPAFQHLVDAFAYDNGFAFTPSSGGFSWSSMLGKGLIGAILGGAIAGIGGLVKWMRGRGAAKME